MTKQKRLNIQGLAVRSELLVGCIKSDPGKIFVARDIIAAEPTITSLLSNCPYYTYATYTGIGKKPYWQNNILFVNDLYLMFGSINPLTKVKIRELFNSDEWMQDPEIVKAKLKKERSFNKLVCLASAYGVGAKKLQSIFLENGYKLSLEQTKEVLGEFWALFKRIKQTITSLTRSIERQNNYYTDNKINRQGFITNLFGFRVTPKKPHDAFNALCQSSVSGLMNLYMKMIFEHNSEIKQEFISVIHDCMIVQIPIENVEKSNIIAAKVLEDLNKELDWSIPIRVDFHSADNFFGLK